MFGSAATAAAASAAAAAPTPAAEPAVTHKGTTESRGAERGLRVIRTLTEYTDDESAYFEYKAQEAFVCNTSGLWLANNADLWYCHMHNQVCEMVKLWPEAAYEASCLHCLDIKSSKGLTKSTFLIPQPGVTTVEEAERAWIDLLNQQEESNQRQMSGGTDMKEQLMQVDRLERSAFLRYTIMITNRNNYRVSVIRHARRSNACPAAKKQYDELDPEAEQALVDYCRHARHRNQRTNSGKSGNACNVRECEMHIDKNGNKAHGHAIHTFNKARYESCGICTRATQLSSLQAAADLYNRDDKQHMQRTQPRIEQKS